MLAIVNSPTYSSPKLWNNRFAKVLFQQNFVLYGIHLAYMRNWCVWESHIFCKLCENVDSWLLPPCFNTWGTKHEASCTCEVVVGLYCNVDHYCYELHIDIHKVTNFKVHIYTQLKWCHMSLATVASHVVN